jgi:hypothetical protein
VGPTLSLSTPLESPAGRSLQHAGGPPLVARRQWRQPRWDGQQRQSSHSAEQADGRRYCSAPTRHASDGNRRGRHLLQQYVGILLPEAERLEGRRRPRDLAPSPSRADDTSTNSCAALASAYTGISVSRSSISATRRGAEAEETAPLRALRSKFHCVTQ